MWSTKLRAIQVHGWEEASLNEFPSTLQKESTKIVGVIVFVEIANEIDVVVLVHGSKHGNSVKTLDVSK